MDKQNQLQIIHSASQLCGDERRTKLIAWFSTQIGITEDPINKIIYNDWFYSKPINGKSYAWCATFMCYGHAQIGMPYPKMGWLKGFCSVPDYHLRSIRLNRLTPDPQLGDDIIFDFENDGKDDHIGKFIAWVDDTKKEFYSIEGNTSFDETGSQSRGGCVAFKKRKASLVSAFITVEHLLK